MYHRGEGDYLQAAKIPVYGAISHTPNNPTDQIVSDRGEKPRAERENEVRTK